MDHLDLTVLNFMENPFGLKRVIIIQVNFNTFIFFLELNHCLLKTGFLFNTGVLLYQALFGFLIKKCSSLNSVHYKFVGWS